MATFVTSAFWHGVEPGYYLAFFTAGLLSSIGKSFRHFVRPFFLPTALAPGSPVPTTSLPKRVYDAAGWFLVQITLNYTVAAFLLLKLDKCLFAWSRLNWYAHIMIFVAIAFFQAGGRRYLRKRLPASAKAKAKPTKSTTSAVTEKDGAFSEGTSRSASQLDLGAAIPPESPNDERDPKDLEWIKHALDNPSHRRERQVHIDGNFVDDLMEGAETPSAESPEPKW